MKPEGASSANGDPSQDTSQAAVHPLEHRVPPPIVTALIGAVMWWAAGSSGRFALSAALRVGAAASLGALALLTMALGVGAFRNSHTTIDPSHPTRASTLVTHGIFAHTRNPMYVAMALALLAWAVYLSSWLALLGPLVFVLFITRFQIHPEERALSHNFGASYDTYRRRVRRWI